MLELALALKLVLELALELELVMGLQLCLGEFYVLQLSQKKVGTVLQVGATHVEVHIGHQLVEAGKVGELTEPSEYCSSQVPSREEIAFFS